MRDKLKTSSKASQELLRLTSLDGYGRKLLSNLEVPLGAADRLGNRMVAAETWVEQAELSAEAEPSRTWFKRLIPAMDVVGHELRAKQKASRERRPGGAAKPKSKARKRSRKSRKHK